MKLGKAEKAPRSLITHPSDPWTKLEICSTWLNKCHSTWTSKILKPILPKVGNRRIQTIERLLADDLVQMPPCRGAWLVGKCYQFHVLHHFLHQSPNLSNCCVWTPRGWINRSPRASATNRIIYSLHKSKATPAVPCIYLSFAYLFRKILAQPVLLRAWGTRKMERACIYHRFREVYVSYVSRNQLQPSQETGCIYGKSSCISVMVLRPQPATADGWLE